MRTLFTPQCYLQDAAVILQDYEIYHELSEVVDDTLFMHCILFARGCLHQSPQCPERKLAE